MCGIFGALHFNGIPVKEKDIYYAVNMLKHRGPDDSGVIVANDMGMGHRRLSIIDLYTGHQPMFNEDKTLSIVFNGEIYNYKELRKELENKGHIFLTNSDTEVIIHSYEEYGPESLQKFDGMFAFAIWNNKERSFFIARDRLGIKPLYYYFQGGILLFASEIKSLLAYPLVSGEVDYSALLDYVVFRYVPAPYAIFKSIKKLLPGHYLLVENNQIKQICYWDISYSGQKKQGALEDCLAEAKQLFYASVKKRLISDVPLGAFLSGGIDSSSIVAVMSSLTGKPVKTFSVGFDTDGFSELEFARIIAKRFKTEHYEVVVTPEDIREKLPRLTWNRDVPLAEPADIPLALLSQLAAKDVKVVLSGEGSDEIFGGYAKYAVEPWAEYFRKVPSFLREHLLKSDFLNQHWPRISSLLNSFDVKDKTDRYASYFSSFRKTEMEDIFSQKFLEAYKNNKNRRISDLIQKVDGLDYLSQMLFMDLKVWLPDNLLERGDCMTMASSIEARVPFLDHRLVEFVSSLGSGLKIKGWTTKYILKKMAEDWLPREIIYRRKVGFTVPIGPWFRKELKDYLRDILLSETALSRGIFEPAKIRSLIETHLSGIRDNRKQLWMLLCLELWFQSVVDK